MEGMKTYDFNCLEKPDRKLIIKGREFIVSGDYPTSLLLASDKYPEMLKAGDTQGFEYILKHLHPVFSEKNDIEYDEFVNLISPDMITPLLSTIMYGTDPEESKKQLEEAMGEKKTDGDK